MGHLIFKGEAVVIHEELTPEESRVANEAFDFLLESYIKNDPRAEGWFTPGPREILPSGMPS